MIDTTTINYAMSKVTEGWEKVAPAIEGIGEKYVRFQVTKAVIAPVPFLFAALVFFFLSKKLWKKKNDAGFLSDWEIPAGICSIAWVLCAFATCYGIYDAAVAVLNPEMYTVQSLIDAARSK